MNYPDLYLNYIFPQMLLLLITWISSHVFNKKTLRFKGINDPKSLVLIESIQFFLYIPLSIISRIFSSDLENWAICFSIISSVYFFMTSCILHLSLPRLNLRNIKKQPQNVNNILWTSTEVCLCILYLSYISILFFQADIQYNTSLPAIDECYQMIPEVILIIAIIGSPMWILMLLQSLRMQHLVKNYKSLSTITSNDAPIVYLRAFGLDKTPALNLKTFDEYLFNSSKETVIISLANPDEIIASGGSIKLQSHDDEWKDVVKELLQQARAVIMVPGNTDGLKWEISVLRKFITPSQLYIVIPSYYYLTLSFGEHWWKRKEILPDFNSHATVNLTQMMYFPLFYRKNLNKFRQLWVKFSEELNENGYCVNKEFPGFNRIISFNSQWESRSNNKKYKRNEILSYVMGNTKEEKKCDYKSLSAKISKYEVNGFVPEKMVLKYRSIVNKILLHNGILTFVLLFILSSIILSGRGYLIYAEKDFKNHMNPELCKKAYLYYIKNNDYQGLKHLLSKSYFTLTLLNDSCPAYKKGMRGEYVLLEFEDWDQDCLISLWDKNEELMGKPKTILVLKNDSVMQYRFENNIGAILIIKCEYEGIKKYINYKYKEWKDRNKYNKNHRDGACSLSKLRSRQEADSEMARVCL